MIALRRSPMTRLLSRRALRTVLALLVLIEVIFLTDIFSSQLERVIRNGGSALDFAAILVLKSPEIVDFALPIVLFLGIYLAVNGARGDNELVICAAAGEPWHRIPRLALLAGTLGLVLSLLFSGLVTPFAAHLLRLSYYDLHVGRILSALTDPDEQGFLREFGGRTFIASPPPDGDPAANGSLFIYDGQPGGGWHVSQADDWQIDGPDTQGGFRVELRRFREYRGGPGSAPDRTDAPRRAGPARTALDFARIDVQTVTTEFNLGDLLEAADPARRFTERYLFQSGGPLAGKLIVREGAAPLRAPTRRFGEMLARALMCPLAAALALAAVAFAGTRQGRFAALPLGLVGVLAGDVFSRAVLGDAAALGYRGFWPAALAVLALGLAPALGYVWLRAEHIIAPPRNQT